MQKSSFIKSNRSKLILVILFLMTACKQYSFNNPVDPIYEISPPINIKIKAVRDDRIVISWKPVTNAHYFEIKRRKRSESSFQVVNLENASSTGFIDYAGVETEVPYIYTFTACAVWLSI